MKIKVSAPREGLRAGDTAIGPTRVPRNARFDGDIFSVALDPEVSGTRQSDQIPRLERRHKIKPRPRKREKRGGVSPPLMP